MGACPSGLPCSRARSARCASHPGRPKPAKNRRPQHLDCCSWSLAVLRVRGMRGAPTLANKEKLPIAGELEIENRSNSVVLRPDAAWAAGCEEAKSIGHFQVDPVNAQRPPTFGDAALSGAEVRLAAE